VGNHAGFILNANEKSFHHSGTEDTQKIGFFREPGASTFANADFAARLRWWVGSGGWQLGASLLKC
jgi:hypothetical protein